ncbi:MAG: hypothetical protein A2931_00010 [Candidatus Niyogibacteria bacterium RIFCSPLOWO2_01_FULL_45_48]|uniref:Uncharacterized protein n=1 Tax=Candidatus Niyogibacteria bacterium RIFCSPLOWO2_01_FULL_45_48 TaxID=1801724 RepID=A0A1G2EW26_9BACT|nr:MAG: hypothetical protein A2931_00010 [Candidatus Niyogibacteria bacterium RIFCSPLOWO2_01_FULL_45_48]
MSAPNEWRGEVLLEFALRLVQALSWPKPGYWFVTEKERVQVLAEKEYCVRFEGERVHGIGLDLKALDNNRPMR